MECVNNKQKTNRKDADPEKTVAYIIDILKKHNIWTRIVEKESYKDKWFSCRIEIDGLPGVGTNGKGITEAYALASAYGELMERLQSGFLLDKLFMCKKKPTNFDEVSNFQQYFPNQLMSYNKMNLKMSDQVYHFIKQVDNSKIDLPKSLVDTLCGSNGLAAGNTYEEALAQGLGEVFERYIMQYIYQADYTTDFFPTVEKRLLAKTDSYQMIEAIEEKGYKVYVRDCSLNGKLPVLGVLIEDPSEQRYFFKLGSDINIDICIQRCITEIFQGQSFDLTFRTRMIQYMLPIRHTDYKKEHIKAETDGKGALPILFLRGKNIISHVIPVVFRDDICDNKKAAMIMSEIAERHLGNVLIADLNTYGFPTIRVFITNCCCSYYTEGDDPLKTIDLYKEARSLLSKGDLNDSRLLEVLVQIADLKCNCYDFSLRKVFGIITQSRDWNLLDEFWAFIGLLSIILDNKTYLRRSISELINDEYLSSTKKWILITIFEYIIQGLPMNQYIETISPFLDIAKYQKSIEMIYKIAKNGMPKIGNNCKECYYKSSCCYKTIEMVSDYEYSKII